MTDIAVFIIVCAVVIRTLLYGIWTLKAKNILGGCFIFLLSFGTAAFYSYLMFRSGY